mmetsp:Transcript_37148/g.63798  ORF Transcript_37148/g.63798 Transcript_37148/m.63798 type:complete len:328 (-) Transcript_37148:658-1641(-)
MAFAMSDTRQRSVSGREKTSAIMGANSSAGASPDASLCDTTAASASGRDAWSRTHLRTSARVSGDASRSSASRRILHHMTLAHCSTSSSEEAVYLSRPMAFCSMSPTSNETGARSAASADSGPTSAMGIAEVTLEGSAGGGEGSGGDLLGGSGSWNDGVEREMSTSTSSMSAAMSAKRGVERYRSPVSASIASITEPSGARLATSSAAHIVPPPEIPVSIPSSRASLCATCMAPAEGTACSSPKSSGGASPSTFGIKSGDQPWIGCGLKAGCVPTGEPSAFRSVGMPDAMSPASSGSASTICTSGRSALIAFPAPWYVPPVPKPVTQ